MTREDILGTLKRNESKQTMCTYLRNSHVDATIVLADIKIEIFAVHAHITAFRQVALEATVVCPEFFEKVR